MASNRPQGRRKKRGFRRLLTLLLTAAVCAGAWLYLEPYLSAGDEPHYVSYTVRRGDIATTKSFSATLSVADSETLYNETGAESVRKLYVSGGQEVQEGDVLMELSDGTVLTAGISGMVNEIRYSEGDWLRSNAQLVQICDLTNLKVSLQIDEYDVDQIRVGQKCLITVVPLNLTLETELEHVSRLSSGTGRVAGYSATAELVAPEDVLPGMTASVTMADEEASGVLLLDMAALSFDSEGKPYVLRRTEEGYGQISVETGLSDGMTVEIAAGLEEGDEVWVQDGVEESRPVFSLSDLYKRIFGETVVINQERGSGGSGRSRGAGGFPAVASGTDMANPGGRALPEGASPTDLRPREGGADQVRTERRRTPGTEDTTAGGSDEE